MNVLLDTHTLLWWLNDHPGLSKNIRSLLKKSDTVVFMSAASVWEISIKTSRGKLTVPENYRQKALESNFLPLAISFDHAAAVAKLPYHHADPFDRMLVAQAQVEQLTLISADPILKKYSVPVLWE